VNGADLEKARAYEDEQRALLGLDGQSEVGKRIQSVVTTMTGRSKVAKVWGHVTQIAITGLLAGSVIALVWLK